MGEVAALWVNGLRSCFVSLSEVCSVVIFTLVALCLRREVRSACPFNLSAARQVGIFVHSGILNWVGRGAEFCFKE